MAGAALAELHAALLDHVRTSFASLFGTRLPDDQANSCEHIYLLCRFQGVEHIIASCVDASLAHIACLRRVVKAHEERIAGLPGPTPRVRGVLITLQVAEREQEIASLHELLLVCRTAARPANTSAGQSSSSSPTSVDGWQQFFVACGLPDAVIAAYATKAAALRLGVSDLPSTLDRLKEEVGVKMGHLSKVQAHVASGAMHKPPALLTPRSAGRAQGSAAVVTALNSLAVEPAGGSALHSRPVSAKMQPPHAGVAAPLSPRPASAFAAPQQAPYIEPPPLPAAAYAPAPKAAAPPPQPALAPAPPPTLGQEETEWYNLFIQRQIPADAARLYACVFVENALEVSQLDDLDSGILTELGVKIGHQMRMLSKLNP